MIRLNDLRSSAGITIIELLIAVTLLGLVLGVAYSLYSFGMTSFARGEESASLQQEARFVARIFTDELRYATKIEILDSIPEALSPGKYLSVRDNTIIVTTVTGEDPEDVRSKTSKLKNAKLKFETKDDKPSTVYFTIELESRKQKYVLDSSVVVLNLDSALPIKTGTVLRYETQ